MVLSTETFNQSVSTEYSEAVNARYTFQPLWVSFRAYSTLKHSLSTTVLVAFHPGFQIKVPQMTIQSNLLQLEQLNSMEILVYFIFKTIKCDRST